MNGHIVLLKPSSKPSVSVTNSSSRITVNSNNPVAILTAQIELAEPSKLQISGVINATFYHVCGVAVYLNDTPLHKGTGTNKCHSDCMQVMYGNGSNGYMCPIPYDLSTDDLLDAGTYEIKVAVLSKWGVGKGTMFVNNRNKNDMASSSTLTVRAI